MFKNQKDQGATSKARSYPGLDKIYVSLDHRER